MPQRDLPEIDWSTRDPSALAARLRSFGLDVDADGTIAFPSGTIRLVDASEPDDRLHVPAGLSGPSTTPESGLPASRPERPRPGPELPTSEPGWPELPWAEPAGAPDLLAVGWATVDRDRVADAARATGLGPVDPLPPDPHLNAFVLHIGPSIPARLVLEPDAEGRLAATLARLGEGPVAIYLSAGAAGLDGYVAGVRAAGAIVSAVRPGPLGPSVILPGGPVWGPHLIVVDVPPAS